MEQSPAYWAATILHPRFKTRWLRRNLPDKRTNSIIASFKRLFQRDYKQPESPRDRGDHSRQPRAQVPSLTTSFLFEEDYYSSEAETVEANDKVERYLSEAIEVTDTPILWWKSHEEEYPQLSRIALDYLSIPTMSAECKRLFSIAKLLFSIRRTSLSEETVCMLLCLKNWLGF